jgi:thioredoxin-related protein
MDFQRWMNDMRTRTALVWFLTSIVVGGMLVFALAAIAAEGGSSKTIDGKGAARAPVTTTGDPSIVWREFDVGLDQAKAGGKRVLVDVYTDWCGWCKRMDRDTYAKTEVQKYVAQAFIPVRLNAESSRKVRYKGSEYSLRQLASGFRVNGYPTTLFFEADGTHIVTAPGYMNASDFLTVLRYIGDGHYKDKDFEQFKAEQATAVPGKK